MQFTRYLYSHLKDPTFYNSLLFRDQTGYMSNEKCALTTLGGTLEQVSCISIILGGASHAFPNVDRPTAWTWMVSIGAFIGSQMIFNDLNKALCNRELDKAEESRLITMTKTADLSILLRADCHLILASRNIEKIKTQNNILLDIFSLKGIVGIVQEYSENFLSEVFNSMWQLKLAEIHDKSINKIKDALLTSCLGHLNDNPNKLKMVWWILQLSKEHQKTHFDALYAFHEQKRNIYHMLHLIDKTTSNEQLRGEYLEKFIALLNNYPSEITDFSLNAAERIIGTFFNLILLQPTITPKGKTPSFLALELDNTGYDVFYTIVRVDVKQDKEKLLVKNFILYAKAEGIISLQRNSKKLLSALHDTESKREFVDELLRNNFHKNE